MASETTTTSMNDITNSALVEPVIIMALSEQPGIALRVCREFNGIGRATNALTIPTQTSYWGSPSDDGAGVDTEFDGTQGTALGNTQVATGAVTCTGVEYGVAHALVDNVLEDSALDGLTLMNLFKNQMLKVLTLAFDDDFLALLASLSNTVGSSGVNLTITNMIDAARGVRVRGAEADATLYILDNQQASDLEDAIVSTSTSMAVYALASDRLINYQPSTDNGLSASRIHSSFHNTPVITSGLTDTANVGADVVGAFLCPSTAVNDATGATTFGMVWKRLPLFETQRQAKGRSTDLVMTMRAGTAELQDGSGTAIITDA